MRSVHHVTRAIHDETNMGDPRTRGPEEHQVSRLERDARGQQRSGVELVLRHPGELHACGGPGGLDEPGAVERHAGVFGTPTVRDADLAQGELDGDEGRFPCGRIGGRQRARQSQHFGHVGVGVVIGEDGLLQAVCSAPSVGAQQPGGREGRVPGVVGVGRVCPAGRNRTGVGREGPRFELHGAHRACGVVAGGDTGQPGPSVVGFDGADGGQHRPGQARTGRGRQLVVDQEVDGRDGAARRRRGQQVDAALKALVTGFDPFGGGKINPSSLAVGQLKKRIGEVVVHTAQLPTSYAHSAGVLRAAIEEVKPEIVLCVGQAGGRTELCLERVAINVQDARIRDNDGKQPIDKPVVKDGPAAHFATLPIKACVAEMRKAGLPAAVSNTAGTFVCNHIFYALMDIAQSHPIPMRGGFLHIPYVPEQAARLGGAPSMALDDMVRGIEIILEVSASRVSDVHTVEGRIS